MRLPPPSDGPGAEVGEEFDHVAGGGDVEVGEGLVEEEEFGVGLEDAGEGGALAHALRVLADGAVRLGSRPTARRAISGLPTQAQPPSRCRRGEVVEVLDGGELVVEHGSVAHVGHAAALVVRALLRRLRPCRGWV